MKTTKMIIALGMIMTIVLGFPDKQHDHMKMMKQGKDHMMQTKPHENMVVSLPSVQCGMCKSTIETGMAKIAGVTSIVVNVETKTANVMYDPSIISPEGIEKSIAGLGYWANGTSADPKAYQDLAGCCQMSDEEYDQMMKKSMMESKSSTMKMMDHENMKMRNHSEMKLDKMNEKYQNEEVKISMTMIDLPTIQCGMCKSRIERELPKVAGIVSVDVIVEKNMGHIMYDPDLITLNEVELAIANIGYQANETPADAKAYRKLPGCCKVN